MESSAENIRMFITSLGESLPPIFDRETASKSLAGMLTSKSLSNADMQGKGPKLKMKLGKKIVYERGAFLDWLQEKFQASQHGCS